MRTEVWLEQEQNVSPQLQWKFGSATTSYATWPKTLKKSCSSTELCPPDLSAGGTTCPQPVTHSACTCTSAERRSTVHNTLHHHVPQVYMFYFRHTTHLIGRSTRGKSPHASLDINTTSNYCSVTTARVAQSVERRTPVWEAPGSNPRFTQLFFFFFFLISFLSSFVENMLNTTQKSHLFLKKKKKKKKKIKKIKFFFPPFSANLSAYSERASKVRMLCQIW